MKARKKVHKKVLFVATTTEFINENCIPIIKWLKENEYEVHIASNGDEIVEYCDKQFNLPFAESKIKTYKQLRQIVQQNNYYFIHCYTLLGGIIARFATRKSEAKVIYTMEGCTFYKNRIIYYPIEKYLSRYTDILITTNEEDYIFAKNKFKQPKVKLINGLGIDKEKFHLKVSDKDKREFLEEFNLKKEDYIFLNIGDLNENNNQILQIEAVMKIVPEYKNIKLLIAGDGPLEEYYNNIIVKYGLSEYIELIGERKDVSSLLYFSDCVLSTSKKDRLPINIIKAMFADKSIIASRIGCYKGLLHDKNLVSLNNSDELIKKIEQHIISGKKKEFYDIEKYKLENVIENIKNIYKSLQGNMNNESYLNL